MFARKFAHSTAELAYEALASGGVLEPRRPPRQM